MVEKTGEQVLATTGVDGQLAKTLSNDWYKLVRMMRRDPTLGFVRDLYMAPLLASDWTVVADDPRYESAVPIIYDSLMPQRLNIMENGIRGLLDFGWQAFEQIFSYSRDGWIKLRKMKPLLQDISYILVTDRGDFNGIRNLSTYLSGYNNAGPWVDLNNDEALLVCRDVEGTNWYGEPLMRRAVDAYNSWNECEASAKRYDTKIAGAQWIVHYPPGKTPYLGALTDNFVIATKILESLKSSGMIAIPRKIMDQITDLSTAGDDVMAWKIELVTAQGSSESAFVGRQKYLDALKSRAIGIPERAVFEGQFGTKAEAEAHADFAIDNIEMAHVRLIEQINNQTVNLLLRINKGEHFEGHVKLEAMPLSDWKRAQLRQLYLSYFATEQGQAAEMENVDWDAIREMLQVPTHEESGQPGAYGVDQQTGQPVKASGRKRPTGELGGLGRRQMLNLIKDVKDMRLQVQSGEVTADMAVDILEARGVDRERATRFLSDIPVPLTKVF